MPISVFVQSKFEVDPPIAACEDDIQYFQVTPVG
jgi:hypothetical protein